MTEAAERSILATLLCGYRDDAPAVASRMLERQDFYREPHRILFSAIEALAEADVPVNVVSVCDALAPKDLDRCGGVHGVAALSGEVISAANLEHDARLVRRAHRERQMRSIGGELAEASSLEAIGSAAQRLDAIEVGAGADISVDLGRAALARLSEVERLRLEGETVASIPWGFSALDKLVGGRRPKRLYILAARPAMGKSAFAQCSMVAAARSERPSGGLFVSLEMDTDTISDRLVSSMARVPYTRIQDGSMTNAEAGRCGAQALAACALPLRVIEKSPGYRVDALRDAVVAAMEAAPDESPIETVWVDYLQLLDDASRTINSREQAIASISRKLKALAKDEGIAVVALAQLNRELEKREDKRPRMSDLRESGAIEQDADFVAFLYRDEYYNEDGRKGVAEVVVSKNRHGPTGNIEVAFDGPTLTFSDLGGHTRW